jgi:hypothetical protein
MLEWKMTDTMPRKKLSIEERLKNLEDRRKKILEKKKEKTRKQVQKRLLDISRLVEKSKIQNLEDKHLLGAFLEIAEKANDKSHKAIWEKKAKALETIPSPIVISFNESISHEAKALLKDAGFRWNKIRREFYGMGMIEEMKTKFKSFNCKIECFS